MMLLPSIEIATGVKENSASAVCLFSCRELGFLSSKGNVPFPCVESAQWIL
jgi:hypothetical protein